MTTLSLTLVALTSAAMLAASTVLYAWVDERQQRGRHRAITAAAALRRRIIRAETRIDTIADHLGLHTDNAPTQQMRVADILAADAHAHTVRAGIVERQHGGVTFRFRDNPQTAPAGNPNST